VNLDKKNYDFKQYPTEGSRRFYTTKFITGIESFKPGTTSPIQDKLTANHSYFQINAYYDRYFKVKKNFSLGLMAEGALNNKKLFSNYTSSLLSAQSFSPTPNSLSMYNEEYRANQFFALGGKAIYTINSTFHCRAEAYGFFPIQSILATEKNQATYADKIFTQGHLMLSTAIVAQTVAGPLSAEVNYYDRKGQNWFFSLNFGYMLFNQRGF
jgi:NTE family protein